MYKTYHGPINKLVVRLFMTVFIKTCKVATCGLVTALDYTSTTYIVASRKEKRKSLPVAYVPVHICMQFELKLILHLNVLGGHISIITFYSILSANKKKTLSLTVRRVIKYSLIGLY